MRKTSWIPLLFAVAMVAGGEAADTVVPLHPDFTGAIMHVGTNEWHPQRVVTVRNLVSLTAGLALTFRDGELVALNLGDGREAWRTKTPDGLYPEVVEHQPGLAFTRLWKKQNLNGNDQYVPDPSAKVHRVSLVDGHWLSPLSVKTSFFQRETQIMAVLAASNGVFVLDGTPGESDLHERQIKSYRVSAFLGDSIKPAWQKDFDSAGAVPSCGVGLLFQGDRLYAKSQVRHLSVMGGTLLVCAGGAEDVLALEAASGGEKWRLPAIWEFKRGFIGPIVWRHFIARFGIDRLPDDSDIRDPDYREEVHATRKRMGDMRKDLAGRCRIVGGPVAVSLPKALQSPYGFCDKCGKYHGKAPSEQYRVFVAVSQGEGRYAGYLSECIIYEINDDGTPIALVTMPRMVLGSECFRDEDAVIWRCERDSLAEIKPSRQSEGMGMGGNGTDCIANLARFVHFNDALAGQDEDDSGTTNWLTWVKANDSACFRHDACYRLSGEPYIRAKDESIVHFPLASTSFNGTSAEMRLTIPFSGEARLPSSNYSRSGSGTRSYCPLYMSILALELQDDQLAITVSGDDGEKAILLFREPEIRERRSLF